MTVFGHDPPFVFEILRFHVRMRTLNVLPPYKGALLRGALDNAFRRTVCPLPRGDCCHCSVQNQCLYIALFHPSPPEDFTDAGKFGNAPPPYVLKPSADNRQAYHPLESLDFSLTLIGRGLDALPCFIMAFELIGRRGLGKERGRYELKQVALQRNGKSQVLYDGDKRTLKPLPSTKPDTPQIKESVTTLTMDLQTPLRIKKNGKLVTRINFNTLYKNLARRLSLLSAFYGHGDPPDFSSLQSQASQIKIVRDQTFWYDWPRYSARQKSIMRMGGLRGRITFEGDLTKFIPWLQLGEKVHVGQGTTFGLGGYCLLINKI